MVRFLSVTMPSDGGRIPKSIGNALIDQRSAANRSREAGTIVRNRPVARR
jgi:hypothetical protein